MATVELSTTTTTNDAPIAKTTPMTLPTTNTPIGNSANKTAPTTSVGKSRRVSCCCVVAFLCVLVLFISITSATIFNLHIPALMCSQLTAAMEQQSSHNNMCFGPYTLLRASSYQSCLFVEAKASNRCCAVSNEMCTLVSLPPPSSHQRRGSTNTTERYLLVPYMLANSIWFQWIHDMTSNSIVDQTALIVFLYRHFNVVPTQNDLLFVALPASVPQALIVIQLMCFTWAVLLLLIVILVRICIALNDSIPAPLITDEGKSWEADSTATATPTSSFIATSPPALAALPPSHTLPPTISVEGGSQRDTAPQQQEYLPFTMMSTLPHDYRSSLQPFYYYQPPAVAPQMSVEMQTIPSSNFDFLNASAPTIVEIPHSHSSSSWNSPV